MKEITGNIFDVDADAICVTTNGVVKSNGELVMGAGIAKQFAERYPWLPAIFGKLVKERGNVVSWDKERGGLERFLVSFPTKEDWRDQASLFLIKASAKSLVKLANELQLDKVVLPRPGCGLGGLRWAVVKTVLEPILDDRFYVITPEVKQ